MNSNFVKVILYSYSRLAPTAEAVQVAARNKALLSYRNPLDTLTLMVRISDEIFLARHLMALKEAVDDALDVLSNEERFLLEYKYFRRKSHRKQFEDFVLGCSQRQYFRKQQALLKRMSALLTRRGWTDKCFMELFGDFSPFKRLLAAIEEGREQKIAVRNKQRVRLQSSPAASGGAGFLPRSTNTATATAAAPPRHRTMIPAVGMAEERLPAVPLAPVKKSSL